MCEGPIIADSADKSNNKVEIDFSWAGFFKRFWAKITDSDYLEPRPKVNMCLKCGDLEIGGEWQKIPHLQKSSISGEIQFGSIVINGGLKVCDFCASAGKEIKEKRKNLYVDLLPCGV